jgi:hypothetical protein
MGIGIKNLIALTTTHPAFGNSKLVRHDFEHRGACRALGNQTHVRRIVERDTPR